MGYPGELIVAYCPEPIQQPLYTDPKRVDIPGARGYISYPVLILRLILEKQPALIEIEQ